MRRFRNLELRIKLEGRYNDLYDIRGKYYEYVLKFLLLNYY